MIKMENHKKVWSDSFARELDQLAQGTKDINGTDTIFSLKKMRYQKVAP